MSDNGNISATVPDWNREYKPFFSWEPAKSLLASIRCYQKYAKSKNPVGVFFKKFAVLRHLLWSIVTGAEVPLNCNIGGGLILAHPNGVVIHPNTIIGPNCTIFQQVTIAGGKEKDAIIGGHVDIGAGAKILNGVVIGDHAKIGANAVVVKDVPEYATAVGIPAKNILKEH